MKDKERRQENRRESGKKISSERINLFKDCEKSEGEKSIPVCSGMIQEGSQRRAEAVS